MEITPDKISNFNLSNEELEYNILFWVAAAGKNGMTAAKTLNRFFEKLKKDYPLLAHLSPFELLLGVHSPFVAPTMKVCGIGCYNNKAKTFIALASSSLCLKTCTRDDLLKIKGIGAKTANGFLLHTRPNMRLACIDTHVLKFLRDHDIMNVPKSTPAKLSKNYSRLEKEFLDICDSWEVEPAALDLAVWNHYRITPKVKFEKEMLYVNS